MVKLLIQFGAVLDDESGRLALVAAVHADNAALVRRLLAHSGHIAGPVPDL
jgi:hypothetical protein